MEQETVQGQVPIRNVGVDSSEFRELSLPVSITEVPSESDFLHLFSALRLDCEGSTSKFRLLIVDVVLARFSLNSKGIQPCLEGGYIFCRYGKGRLRLRILSAFVEYYHVFSGIIDGFPSYGDIGSFAFLNGDRLNNGLGSCKNLVATHCILAPCEFGKADLSI